jgi:hypothetical protein
MGHAEPSIALFISIAVAFSGCGTVRSSARLYPAGYKPVPREIISLLPARIGGLPQGRAMTHEAFLRRLGLLDYEANITGSIRFNSHFLILNERHTLQIRMTHEFFAPTNGAIDDLIEGVSDEERERRWLNRERSSDPGCIRGCTLRRDRNIILADRVLRKAP